MSGSTKKPKRPSLALRRKLKPLIDAATRGLILSGPTTEGAGAYPQVVVVWPLTERGGAQPDTPEGFPVGYRLERTETTVKMKHSCRKLVNWFFERGYISYSARDIMEARQGIIRELTNMENDLEKLLAVDQGFVYNDCIE